MTEAQTEKSLSDRPSGVILAEPPGTGKALLARLIGGSCGCYLEILAAPNS